MAFGFGPGAEMTKSVKSNLAQKGKRKTYFERQLEKSEGKKELSFKKLSPEEFAVFKQELKIKTRKRNIKIYLISGVIMSFIIGMMIYFL